MRRLAMARIEIKDLPKEETISREEMRNFIGGASYTTSFAQFSAAGVMQNKGGEKAFPTFGTNCSTIYFNIHESV
jgi:hypothetical protein